MFYKSDNPQMFLLCLPIDPRGMVRQIIIHIYSFSFIALPHVFAKTHSCEISLSDLNRGLHINLKKNMITNYSGQTMCLKQKSHTM